ncbi:hypothetical protein MMC28_010156 [Mycoblastus sanguinarius]|nr:hypothetical protein [Mycoblastus sanguinarius]
MPNILITGAASGIGKAFVHAYLHDPENCIIAVDKNYQFSSQKHHLEDPSDTYRKVVGVDAVDRLQVLALDLTDENQLSRQLSIVHNLDLVIHSAGIRGLVPSVPINQSSDVPKTETMDVMTGQTLQTTLNVNAVGSFFLIRELISKFRPDRQGHVIVMGSRLGSVGHNATGGGYAYRASKAALNAIVKSFSVDVPEITFAIVHPGRVESGLVSVKEDGAIGAEESVCDMLKIIGRLDKTDSGRFIDRFGVDIPW